VVDKEQVMKSRLWFGLALALVSLSLAVAARADDEKDKKKDAPDKEKVAAEDKKFEGTWVVTKMESGGRVAGEEQLGGMSFVIKGKKYEQKRGDELIEAGTQDLDPTKSPKHMDVTVTEGETKGEKQLAIYEIEGDKIRACFAQHGSKERPTKFESKEGSDHIYIEMKRKKKD
jgi:uncharacterized protein (TIGR03067 family)